MAIRARADNLSLDYPEQDAVAPLVDFADVWAHREVLRQACVRLTGDVARAEDLVHDTFVSALKSSDRLERRTSIGPWLATVARRRSIDEIRGRQRVALVATTPEPAPSYADDPADHVLNQELVAQLWAAVDTLTDRERQLLLRQATYGMSLAELAAEEQTSVASVRSVLARARQKLRMTLERNGALGVLPLPRVFVSLREKFNRWAVQFESALPTLAGASAHVSNVVVAVVAAIATMLGGGPPLGGDSIVMVGVSEMAAPIGGLVAPTARPSAQAGSSEAGTADADEPPINASSSSGLALPGADGPVPLPPLPPQDSQNDIDDAAIEYLSSSEDGEYVFAAGLNNAGNRTIFRSSDAGVTWTRLAADGYRTGRVLVPPTYPHTPTLFAVDDIALWRSNDHGAHFLPVAPARGGAAFSPGYAAGDRRLFLAGSPVLEYSVASGLTNPITSTAGLMSIRTVFPAESFAVDGALLLGGTIKQASTVPQTGVVYRCTVGGCSAPVVLPGMPTAPDLRRLADGTIVAWDEFKMYVSTDGGASFTSKNWPVPYGFESIVDGAPGELLLTVTVHHTATGLFRSTDAGASWTGIGFGTPLQRGGRELLRLAGGDVIGAPQFVTGITCSGDGGGSWAPSC